MKTKLLFLSVILISSSIVTSCIKTDHQIRFQNQYAHDINNLVIGPDNFGTVGAGQTSSYQSIPEGSGNVSGTDASNGAALTGSYSISGKGKHQWTVVLSSTGKLSIVRDK